MSQFSQSEEWLNNSILSILASTSIGTCTNYVQPLQVHRYVHVPASKQPLLVCARTSRTDLLYSYSYKLWYVYVTYMDPVSPTPIVYLIGVKGLSGQVKKYILVVWKA